MWNDGKNYTFVYAHLQSLIGSAPRNVAVDEMIFISGCTGTLEDQECTVGLIIAVVGNLITYILSCLGQMEGLTLSIGWIGIWNTQTTKHVRNVSLKGRVRSSTVS